MGRHRRSDAGRAASGRAGGVTPEEQPPAERYGPENLYGFAAVLEEERLATRSHRKKKAATPVRTGLLGVSAAVALGTAAVATGVLPGAGHFTVSGDQGEVEAGGVAPSGFATEQGGTSGSAEERGAGSTSRGADRTDSPAATPSASPSTSAPAEEKPSEAPTPTATETPTASATTAPPAPEKPEPPKVTPPVEVSDEAAAGAAVLNLVNQERAKVGCSPLTANAPLQRLAADFSQDMATRNFFDHTDPGGKDPWDRAGVLGITGLGGENIARGQATAEAVMEAWMNSPGHRANILNCDFQTLGVGVHFGSGGPWWTQDFGY
ncbi:CAP domain-containing protein [Streptomyces sp. SID2888]|uniref:CAP domain-containing protein n=1 Tax=Streptomyces sp. SID2888 TaxID=2690256 RepID=UPI00136AE181|nr:CAP domain-containing protein [Streptomyces sp. SID2888]MYV48485.1 CAP domain-containing protein [Streptomyces sp. SID2888]